MEHQGSAVSIFLADSDPVLPGLAFPMGVGFLPAELPLLRAVCSGSPWQPGAPWRVPLLAAYVSSFESCLFSSSSRLLTGELGVWCLCGNHRIFNTGSVRCLVDAAFPHPVGCLCAEAS